jgi:hypothetical protein
MLQISGSDFQPTVPLNLRDHFKVSRKNSLLFYCSCFFSLDIQHTLNLSKSQKILSNYFFKPTNVDGSWDCKEIEEYIRKKTSNCLKHSIMNSNEKHFKELYSDSTLDFLKSIKKYCELNDVRLLIHFVPDNHSYFDQFDSCRLNDLLRKISEITDFWYFSGYNSITANDTNYYDIIHYRLSVADLMIKKIFTDTVFEPKDFGIYLTVANINQVIDFTNKQFINRDTINN